jgi:protein-arginine kinase activator protein McsA
MTCVNDDYEEAASILDEIIVLLLETLRMNL